MVGWIFILAVGQAAVENGTVGIDDITSNTLRCAAAGTCAGADDGAHLEIRDEAFESETLFNGQ
jgi:hypothetical protein